MKIILLEQIDKLGEIGSIVDVKGGYAKNYLIPKQKALIANEKNITLQKKNLYTKNITEKTNLNIIKKISNTSILISVSAKDNGDLYGPINSIKLIKILKIFDINLKTKNFITNIFIKNTGQYKIDFKIDDHEIFSLYLIVIKTNK